MAIDSIPGKPDGSSTPGPGAQPRGRPWCMQGQQALASPLLRSRVRVGHPRSIGNWGAGPYRAGSVMGDPPPPGRAAGEGWDQADAQARRALPRCWQPLRGQWIRLELRAAGSPRIDPAMAAGCSEHPGRPGHQACAGMLLLSLLVGAAETAGLLLSRAPLLRLL